MHNPPHPGEVLKEMALEPMGLSITATAQALEPDAGGKWQIVWRIARSHAMMLDGIDDFPTIRRVEQKIRNGKATSLIFKDADGEKWQELL